MSASASERPREQEALTRVAVGALQVLELGQVLDALAEGLEVERLAQVDEGLDERGRLLGGGDALDEGAVDLERVDRELTQVGERAVAGAEVVDGDPDAERLESRAGAGPSASGSFMSAVSVISTRQRRRLEARLGRALRTSSISSSWSSWRPETLTLHRERVALGAPRRRLAAGRRAAPSARSAAIRPLRSAIGMKTSGAMTPRLAWRQRSSASTPVVALGLEVEGRLVDEEQLARRRARRPGPSRA